MDQQLGSVTSALEQLLCQGLGLPAPVAAIRNLKLSTLKQGLGQRQTDEQGSYNQAFHHFKATAPNTGEFEQRLQRVSQRNVKGHKELLCILHKIATDPQLASLNGPLSVKPDTVKPPVAATLPLRQSAPGVTAKPAPAVSLNPGNPAPRASVTPAATVASTPGPAPTPIGHGAGYSTPMPSMPAVSTPMQPVAVPAQAAAMPAASRSTQAATQQGYSRPMSAASGSVQGGQLESPRNPVSNPASSARPTPYSNPFYGQDDAASPAVRQKDYTPSLAPTINWGQARMRSAANTGAPVPNVPAAGDLFIINKARDSQAVAGKGGAMTSGSGSPGVLAEGGGVSGAYGALPSWNSERPHLTGLDLVRAANTAALAQAGTSGAGTTSESKEALSRLPPQLQELAIMNDLLYGFMGLDGKYVRAVMTPQLNAPPGAGPCLTFAVQPGLEPCLQELVERVVPLCEYVAVLQRFVETRSAPTCGLVSHAVAAAVRGLLQDWWLMVTQLEHQLRLGRLTLQALVFHCQGPLATLGLLANLAAHAASARLTSAGLLNLLHTKASALAGDRVGRALLHKILHAAAVPYFRMLERWLCEGVLEDPHGEFMVREDKAVTKDALTEDKRSAYWYTRYTLRPAPSAAATGTTTAPASREGSPARGAEDPEQQEGEQGAPLDVPVFLQGCATMILTTGKYLNAMRECGRPMTVKLPAGQSLAYDPANAFLQAVHSAHASASAALLQLLLADRGLLGWLRSLKHWFLLDAGDVVVGLAEVMREELGKAARDVSRPRLQSLLELAVRTSSVGADAHADDLAVELDPRSLLELARAAGVAPHVNTASTANTPAGTPGQAGLRLGGRSRAEELPGWEVVLLSYRVAWPLTLVVPPKALAQYQLIFRYLWGMKRAERELSSTWHRMQAARNAARSGREALKHAYALCYRQLWLAKELVRYGCVDVLEPAWRAMEEGVRRAGDVDAVIRCHEEFQARAMDGLLLSRPPLLRALTALQAGALAFCERVNKAWDALDVEVEAAAQAAAAAAAQQALLQRQASASVAAGRAGRVSASGATGAQRVPAAGTSTAAGARALSSRREAGYASLSAGGAGPASAFAPSAAANIELGGLADDMTKTLGELVGGLQALYGAAMRREASSPEGEARGGQALLETREGLEALQGLIERLDMGAGAGAPQAAQGAAAGTTRAMYNALAAQAAALG